MEKNAVEVDRLKLHSKNYLEVKYEDLLAEPERILSSVCGFIGTSKTEMTDRVLRALKTEQLDRKQEYPLNEIDDHLVARAEKVLKKYHYPLPAQVRRADRRSPAVS